MQKKPIEKPERKTMTPNDNDCIGAQAERECTNFLYREAELLDNWQFNEWLELLSTGIDYRVPVRTTREKKSGDGFSSKAFFMEEDYSSLKMRVARLGSDFAWSENPRTRTRRMVSNVRVAPGGDGALDVASNVATFCHRGDSAVPLVLTYERKDVLEREAGRWKIARRLVLLDTTVLGLESLSIFL
jgi:3-phenylpropionate/cinnamic acid dioxygenase small subunit